jgi:hypothetical protein
MHWTETPQVCGFVQPTHQVLAGPLVRRSRHHSFGLTLSMQLAYTTQEEAACGRWGEGGGTARVLLG